VFFARVDVDVSQFEAAIAKAGYSPARVQRKEPEAARRNRRHGGDQYDLAIVGSGGAAFAAAISAVERGARVVMIERGTLGGTCVNIGCVPSKTQLRAAELFWQANHQPFAGIATSGQLVNLPALVEQKTSSFPDCGKRSTST
jgi:mercuric reductase